MINLVSLTIAFPSLVTCNIYNTKRRYCSTVGAHYVTLVKSGNWMRNVKSEEVVNTTDFKVVSEKAL